jgi:acetylornithine deacetylase/succinyl-diaminopimelate desuccinylase-like protein
MEALINFILDQICKIQSIPAPTFNELERGKYILSIFQNFKLQNVEMDSSGNVYGFLPGGPKKPLIISAHLDTVHSKDIDHRISKTEEIWSAPGIGDNVLALASLIGLINYYKKNSRPLSGGVWFIANVGEEGLGNLVGIKKVVERFGDNVNAYIVLEGLGLGVIFHKALGVQRFRVEVKTKGGHAWGDYGNPSAIHEIAKFISQLNLIQIPREPRSSLNIGTIVGGTTINSIACYASCDIDIRSEKEGTLFWIIDTLQRLIEKNSKNDVEYTISKIGSRPSGEISVNHWLVQLAIESLDQMGMKPVLATGSTDASYPLSKGLPAICICITQGGNVHTADEFIELKPIQKGIEQVMYIIDHAWN